MEKKGEDEDKYEPASALPPEIIEEILRRLPVKTLIRFTCVCKRWRSLVSDPRFDRSHSDLAKRPRWKHPMLFTNEDGGTSYAIPTVDCDGNHELLPLYYMPVERDTFFEPIEVLGSCHGLLFVNGWLRLYTNAGRLVTTTRKFILWNPYTNSVKAFDQPIAPPSSASGLCYDYVGDDYKAIVCTNPIKNERRIPSPSTSKENYYVFSLRNNSWRPLDHWEFLDNYILGGSNCATTVGGVPYWTALRFLTLVVVCFDPVTEKFREVPLPDGLLTRPITLGQLGDCLSIVTCGSSSFVLDNSVVHVWVTKDYTTKESWVKLYSLELPHSLRGWFLKPLGYSSTGDVVLLARSSHYSSDGKKFHEIWNFNVKDAMETKVFEFYGDSDTYFQTLAYSETLLCPWET